MSQADPPEGDSTLVLAHGDALAAELTRVIHDGDLSTLQVMLDERPEPATDRHAGRAELRQTHGYATAAGWAVFILVGGAVIVGLLVNAPRPPAEAPAHSEERAAPAGT